MKNLTREQALGIVNDVLKEDLDKSFNQQVINAGERGEPSFMLTNSKGESVEVFVDWNKEEDVLSYTINEDFKAE